MTHASAGDSWTLIGKSGSVSCGVIAPLLLGPGVYKVLFVPSKSLLPQSCESFGGSIVGLMVTSSKRAYAITQVCCIQSSCPCGRPLLTHTSTLKGRSGLVSVGPPAVHKILFEPSEHLWWVWGLVLNAISPLLPSCWGFFFVLGSGVSFFGGVQHFPADGY